MFYSMSVGFAGNQSGVIDIKTEKLRGATFYRILAP